MSYILDALRKSDQQRQRGVPPTLLAPQAAAVESRRRIPMSYLLLTAALVGAGIVVGSLRPWQNQEPGLPTKSAAGNPLESTPHASPAPVQPQMAQQPAQDAPKPKVKPAIPSAAVLGDSTTEKQARAAATPQTEVSTLSSPHQAMPAAPRRGLKPVPDKPQGAGTGTSVQQQKLLTIAELPLSIRQEIPAMSISVHAYSREPGNRLVGINDRVLHEGEDVAPGLRLEEITRDGMILRYKGYRFLRGVR